MTATPDPAAALAAIQRAAAEGRIEFAPDSLADALDAEIQAIYAAIRFAQTGKPPRRPIWASDKSWIGDCLPLDKDGIVSFDGLQALGAAASSLGILLSPSDTWVEAALRLRAKNTPAATKD